MLWLTTPLWAVLIAAAAPAPAPYDPRSRPMSAERPDFTDSTSTVGRGVAQVETGFTLGRRGAARHRSFGDSLLRVGTSATAEIRLQLPALASEPDADGDTHGWSDMGLSFKMRLTPPGVGRGLIHPKVALTLQTTVPSGSVGPGEAVWQPGIKLGLGWNLSERVGLATNLVWDRASEDGARFGRWTASASLEYKPNGRLHPIVEMVRFMPDSPGGKGATFFSSGAVCWLSKDLQFDALGAARIDGDDERSVTAGISRRW
jgi:hypothetical protein